MNSIKRLINVPLLLLLLVGGLQAEVHASVKASLQSDSLTSPVESGSRITYFDLLRKLLPDLQVDKNAHRTIPLRSILEPRKRSAIAGDITLDFKPYWVKSGGRRLLLLWVNLKAEGANESTPYEGEADVLALFRLEPGVKLLDAMDVKTDRFTGFWEDRSLFHLDSRNDALIVYNTHWNSGESYLSLEMMFVDAGRFKTITSQFIYNTQGCGIGFTETPYFRAIADASRKYPKILVRVKLRKEADEEGCEHRQRGYTRYYQGLYRWNAARSEYMNESQQLERLDRFNERRISSP